jgi:1,4-dihydroxy-2-naphthoate octaprenyltransferase
MFSKSTWLHLRIPFSFFLMPVFFFALAISPNLNASKLGWSLLIIHLFLYPASNGYNSYFDKDEKSIGGLKNPPPVNKSLYYTSLFFDAVALVLGWLYINELFVVMMLIYGLASKAYSHPAVRLKKYPVAGWLTVVFFQGFFTFIMCYVAINNFGIENLLKEKVLWAAVLTSVMLFATYPMTQVYQHEEDARRGDQTISLKLGIRGTFYFAMAFFGVSSAGFIFFFQKFYELHFAFVFLLALGPVVIFFFAWFARVFKDPIKANHSSTMWLNFISATCLNGFFIYFFLETSHILQL